MLFGEISASINLRCIIHEGINYDYIEIRALGSTIDFNILQELLATVWLFVTDEKHSFPCLNFIFHLQYIFAFEK